jgi:hypothetical protein
MSSATTTSASLWYVTPWIQGTRTSTNTNQDGCNTEGENGKQGGTYEDQCARWHLQFI